MRSYSIQLIMKTYFSFLFLLCFSIAAYACPFSSTSLQGGGTLNQQLCAGDSETFVSGPTGCPFANNTHEWIIKRSTYIGGGNYSSYQPYQTVIQNGNSPLNFTFNDPGRYEITVVIRNPNNFNQIDAYPCSGTGSCTRAQVWVQGPVQPIFTVDQISCTYDPVTGIYTNEVAILPDVDKSGTSSSLNGTRLDIDWGDGNTEWTRIFWNTTHTPIHHTYTWHANTIAPTIIAVNANGVCGDKAYSTYYSPVPEYYDIQFEVIEEDCDRHIVCVSGIPPFTEVGLYGPNGEEGTFMECMEFWLPGPYTLVIPTPGGCPQVITYTATFGANPGTFSIGQTAVTPGQSLDLNLTGHTGDYIAYEILVDNCNGAPEWVIFEYGPANIYDNHTVNPGLTQQFLPCMLNENFEFCFRARVLCGPFDPETYENSSISNEVCLKVCASDTEGVDGNDDENPYEGLLSGEDSPVKNLDELQKHSIGEHPEFQIYPNPTTDKFFIEMDAIQLEKVLSVQVVNILGQTVWQSTTVNPDGSLLEIDINQHPAGIYQVLISDGAKRIKTTAIVKTN